MICFPHAKINLGLHVINKRDDGYHNIETVFYPVKCTDMLEIIEPKTGSPGNRSVSGIVLSCEGAAIAGAAADNLVVKAYYLLAKDHTLPPVDCILYKHIPAGAGLGGGSSDAAFMIRLLNDKYSLGLDAVSMQAYAAQLGSDCAFFTGNKPAYAYGRGDELEPFELDLSEYHLELLYPGIHSSTALAYQHVQRRETMNEETSLKQLLREPVRSWKETIANDFERSVFGAIPGLLTIKEQLYAGGALYAAMSGSGSCMFGIFSKPPVLPDALSAMRCYSGPMQQP